MVNITTCSRKEDGLGSARRGAEIGSAMVTFGAADMGMVGQITENWNAILGSIQSSGPILRQLWTNLRPLQKPERPSSAHNCVSGVLAK